jgi:threonine dehydrogenase-like Zn-dependent dehydrogenase
MADNLYGAVPVYLNPTSLMAGVADYAALTAAATADLVFAATSGVKTISAGTDVLRLGGGSVNILVAAAAPADAAVANGSLTLWLSGSVVKAKGRLAAGTIITGTVATLS